MIQGEIEKSIKTIDQVANAKVLITPATDSVFAKDKTEGSASVVIETKPGREITEDQVKGIVAVISMSTENIPEEKIAIIDKNGNLLTKKISGESDTSTSSETLNTQQTVEAVYEDKMVEKITQLLEPVVGQGKVKTQVDVDFDFDSKKVSEYEVDPNKALISQETSKEYNSANGGTTSESPIDNNMSNTISDDTTETDSGSEHQIDNYDHSTKKTEIIKAPGEIRRMTADRKSVV